MTDTAGPGAGARMLGRFHQQEGKSRDPPACFTEADRAAFFDGFDLSKAEGEQHA